MQAAQILAGYTLGGADMLRRAMGKKIKAEMDNQRAIFVKGCAEVNKIPAAKANELFDLIDKFAGYGFNKSHAAAYALLAYQTAWLKAHYPHEFFAASMAYDIHQTDKLAIFADDMRRLGIDSLPPDINKSLADFTVEMTDKGPAVRYALGALKGVGEKAMELLVEERSNAGPFKSLDDFARRVDPRLINKRQLETLAGAGAFDALEKDRAALFAGAEIVMAVAQRTHENRISGQGGLFGESDPGAGVSLPKNAHWSLADRIGAEKDAFGYYFSAHPLDRYRHLIETHRAQSIATLNEVPIPEGQRVGTVIAALIEDCRYRTSARGNRYLMATVSDTSAQTPATCFDEQASKDMEECAKSDGCALLTVELDKRAGEDTPRVSIRRVQPLDELANSTRLILNVAVDDARAFRNLAAILADQSGGRGEVVAKVPISGGEAELVLGRGFRLDGELAQKIDHMPGVRWASLNASDNKALAEAA